MPDKQVQVSTIDLKNSTVINQRTDVINSTQLGSSSISPINEPDSNNANNQVVNQAILNIDQQIELTQDCAWNESTGMDIFIAKELSSDIEMELVLELLQDKRHLIDEKFFRVLTSNPLNK